MKPQGVRSFETAARLVACRAVRALLLVVGLSLAGPALADAPRSALRVTLEKMYDEDQAEAAAAMRGEAVKPHGLERVALLKQIVAEFGWPRRSQVGAKAAKGAWVVAQHSDDDLEFQRACLAQMELVRAEVDPVELAYLTDRVASAQGKPQPYGTQGSAAVLYTPAMKLEVEARRKAIGLPTMAEEAQAVGRAYDELRKTKPK